MTEAQKEYIITEDELRRFYECALIHDMPDAPTICAFIRSHPATPTITEQVLKQLKMFVGQNIENIETDEGEIVQMVHYGELLAWIDEQGEKCKKCQP